MADGMPEHVHDRYTHIYSANGDGDGVHIGASWRIRLNRPCAAAMRPFVKLLRPLVLSCAGGSFTSPPLSAPVSVGAGEQRRRFLALPFEVGGESISSRRT